MDLTIVQVDKPTHRCEVRAGEAVLFAGGRVACKRFAEEHQRLNGSTIYNIKRNGARVLCRDVRKFPAPS